MLELQQWKDYDKEVGMGEIADILGEVKFIIIVGRVINVLSQKLNLF